MSAPRSLKPRPIFRLLFFMVGVYFGWQAYVGQVDSAWGWGYFQYFCLYPGLCFYFCWYAALRGSAGWNLLPRWMMTGGAGRTGPGEMPPVEKDDQLSDDGHLS